MLRICVHYWSLPRCYRAYLESWPFPRSVYNGRGGMGWGADLSPVPASLARVDVISGGLIYDDAVGN